MHDNTTASNPQGFPWALDSLPSVELPTYVLQDSPVQVSFSFAFIARCGIKFCVRLYGPYVRVPGTLPHCLIYTDDVIGHTMVWEWS